MDLIIVKFVGENWLTISLILCALKGIAIITPSVKDDEIVTLLINMFNFVGSNKELKEVDTVGLLEKSKEKE